MNPNPKPLKSCLKKPKHSSLGNPSSAVIHYTINPNWFKVNKVDSLYPIKAQNDATKVTQSAAAVKNVISGIDQETLKPKSGSLHSKSGYGVSFEENVDAFVYYSPSSDFEEGLSGEFLESNRNLDETTTTNPNSETKVAVVSGCPAMENPKLRWGDETESIEQESRCDVHSSGREVSAGQPVTAGQAVVSSCPIKSEVTEVISTPKQSFVSLLQGKTLNSAKISEMRNDEFVDGASVVLPLDLVKEMHTKYENTLFGYFLGKRLAFPVVEHYVKNVWNKFGLERVMLKDGFFLFKFSSKDGMDKVLESGPWLIRFHPLILNVWTPNTVFKKEALTRIPVWVKVYNIPLVAFSDKGLSLITTQIGRPIMMDSFTSDRCMNPWGKSNYARVLIEVSSEFDLPESVVIAIPALDGKSHGLEKVKIEYEWKPPRCSSCKLFDHTDDNCPKMIKTENVIVTKAEPGIQSGKMDDEGFVEVKRKKKKKKKGGNSSQISGIKLPKPAVNFQYHPIAKEGSSRGASDVVLTNGFESLRVDNIYDSSTINCSDSDADEEIIVEDPDGKRRGHGMTTPHGE